MQTSISTEFKNNPHIAHAEDILRSCVHCGFCTATCPTYQLLGDELDSPRGRIYQIKQLLEGHEVSASTQNHLDRCLLCRSCETTCPSGVKYGQLLEIGRQLVDQQVKRSLLQRAQRFVLRQILPRRKLFNLLLTLGRISRPLLPAVLRNSVPKLRGNRQWAQQSQSRKMLVLDGCVQPGLSPQINATASRVLSRLGIELINVNKVQCCGAVNQHLNDEETAADHMRRNIDAWYPLLDTKQAEAIVITASGCGAMVKEYAHHLRNDQAYAEKAQRISEACKDISEILLEEDLSTLDIDTDIKVSFHAPCTLQHAQKLGGVVENILTNAGFELDAVADAHLCCGSAGTYSILQPAISQQLKINKLDNLQQCEPDVNATANIGCLHQLASGTDTPVVHWIELLDSQPVN